MSYFPLLLVAWPHLPTPQLPPRLPSQQLHSLSPSHAFTIAALPCVRTPSQYLKGLDYDFYIMVKILFSLDLIIVALQILFIGIKDKDRPHLHF